MPQDIPLESSEKLVFTPASLKDIDGAPSFVLRAATPRDRRFHQRRFFEEGISRHGMDDIRAEILVGLKKLWGPEDYAQHEPIVKSYWDARDEFELQRKDEPTLTFSFDPEIARAVDELIDKVSKTWPKLRVMMADNLDFEDMVPLVLVSVVVESWSGLDVPRRIDRGYLTTDCAGEVQIALGKFEQQHAELYDLKAGTAWIELFGASAARLVLDQEEAGNSESPSLSDTTPGRSSETTTSAKVGRSRKSASSSKTPVTG